ncbi:MAG: FAD-binding protein [Opitutales bacterium]|nr:FAD-binding protein [Opitutales bacterium]
MGIKTCDCDVLIVGGGLSGLQAAITIREKSPSKKVVIADLGGGASSEVMGFCAPMGAEDSPECFIEDTLRAGAGENNPEIVNRLCRDASSVVASLEKIGIVFDHKPDGTYDMLRSLGSTYHRVVHYKTLTGETAMAKYKATLESDSLVEFQKSRIVKLFKKCGKITGALGFKDGEAIAYNTPSVILATGGAAGLYSFSSWTKMLQGSGYAMALDVGVELTGMHRVQFEPCVAVFPEQFYGFPIITTMLFEGAKLIDAKGNSLLKPDMPTPAKRQLAEMIASAVADGGDCGHGGVWFDISGVDEKLFETKYPEYYKKLRPIVADYKDLRIEVKPAAHTTLGGVIINEKSETSVAGLFAAGEVSGGVHGKDRIGGNAGLEIFVFGRAAGESVSEYNGENCDISADCQEFLATIPVGSDMRYDILANVGNILDTYVGVYRKPEDSKKCLAELAKIRADLQKNPPNNKEHYLTCHNALITAEQLARF